MTKGTLFVEPQSQTDKTTKEGRSDVPSDTDETNEQNALRGGDVIVVFAWRPPLQEDVKDVNDTQATCLHAPPLIHEDKLVALWLVACCS